MSGPYKLYTAEQYIEACAHSNKEATHEGYYEYLQDQIYNNPNREERIRAGNAGKMAGAAAAAFLGLDTHTAFHTADNAIENNFLALPIWAYAAICGLGTALKAKDIIETSADAYEAYEKEGMSGLAWFMCKEGAIRYALGKAGKGILYVGGKAYDSAKGAAQAMIERNPSIKKVGGNLAVSDQRPGKIG